ncbi:MAG: HAD family hydrolase [Paludibacter sp.]|nr:HAD family hydrolase [Paludibacter sp.]
MKSALFLDRDGVINRQIVGGYVTKKDEFEFLPEVIEAIEMLSKKYDYIFIVTNQQGIGKGIFSAEDLNDIHTYMLEQIENQGGHIDKIYFCPALETENSIFRKPAPGMGQLALNEYPDIDLKKSVMVGDAQTDLQFGKNLGVKTVFLSKGKTPDLKVIQLADAIYNDLPDFVKSL